MGMPETARRYTVDEVLAFPSDGNRYELVAGELLVSPAPTLRHQRIVSRVYAALSEHVRANPGVAEVLFSPADITWGGDEELVQPDVFVVPASETHREWRDIHTLLLVVETLSPSTARYDRITKRRLYQHRGVTTYWVIDPDARLVEVWHPGDERPEIVTDRLTWRVVPEAPELTIRLQDLFAGLPA